MPSRIRTSGTFTGPRTNQVGVRTFGRIPLAEVQELYRSARVFALPSEREPSATVLMEAAGFGLPVVTTDVGGSAERVSDCRTGFLIAPGDVDGLTTDLLDLLRKPEKAARFGKAGSALVRGRFRWEIVGRKFRRQIDRAFNEDLAAAG